MSLLNKNKAFSVRDCVFIALGLVGLFFFFFTYDSHDPRSIIDTSLEKRAVELKAVEKLNSLGYQPEGFKMQSNLESEDPLLDSLQLKMGRRKMISAFSDTTYSGIHPYYWRVSFANNSSAFTPERLPRAQDPKFELRFDMSGRMIGLDNGNQILPDRQLNREALISAFQTDSTLKLWTSLPDSAWDRVLTFNLTEDYSPNSSSDTLAEKNINDPEKAHEFTRAQIRRLAEFHLKNTGWESADLSMQSIQAQQVQSMTAAEVRFTGSKPEFDQSVNVEATVLPTGMLMGLNYSYNNATSGTSFPNAWNLVQIGILLVFGIGVLIIFYFRIRARAVDTKPALVVGVISGITFPAVMLLHEIKQYSLLSGDVATERIFQLAISMGFSGAFASVGFFILFAVADSLLRQYWPQKLSVYDYMRQGMFFNKPIGETLVRSIILAFMLCGAWSVMLFLFPNLYFDVFNSFLKYEAAWPPIYIMLSNFWNTALVVLGVFAVVMTQIFGSFKNTWMAAAIGVLGFSIMPPMFQHFGPVWQQTMLFFGLGILITAIFLRWGLITTLFTVFVFTGMIEVSSGWVVPSSPDLYVFLTFCGFLLFVFVTGTFAIVKGQERQSLPTFVPEYVEELAQEQRIKQELQIAREVQQSFLPVRTPEFDELELAAICKPAYETGGDYYDFVRLDDYRVAVMIGDVSGKGIQAAFYMTFVKGVIHSLCREIDSPAAVLKKTNHLFCENAPSGTFISLIYGIVDLRKKQFYFARAGHNPILRITSGNGQVEELQPKGIGIGLAKGDSFDKHIEEVELSLSEDDILVLYTDGITEALNEGHTFYGSQRLNSTLKRNKQKSAKEILELLANDVRTFIGNAKQHDDMTMLIMKLKKTMDDS